MWMDRLRRVVERNDRHGFELMGPCTNPLASAVSSGRLYSSRQSISSAGKAKPGSTKKISSGPFRPGCDVRYIKLIVMASYAQGHCQSDRVV